MDTDEQFDLNKFDMNELKERSPIILIIGMSGAGKSWLVRDIMSNFQNVKNGKVFAPAEKIDNFYNSFISNGEIYYDMDNDELNDFQWNQTNLIHGNEPDVDSFLIMDDCQSSSSFSKIPNFNEIIFNHKHLKINPLIITAQYAMDIYPTLRANSDYVFIFGEAFINNKHKLHDHYAGIFPSFDLFNQIFTQITNDFGCMVINNKIKTDDVQKKVFWYKAEKKDDFKI